LKVIVSLPFVVNELDLRALIVSVPFVVAELDLGKLEISFICRYLYSEKGKVNLYAMS